MFCVFSFKAIYKRLSLPLKPNRGNERIPASALRCPITAGSGAEFQGIHRAEEAMRCETSSNHCRRNMLIYSENSLPPTRLITCEPVEKAAQGEVVIMMRTVGHRQMGLWNRLCQEYMDK